MLADRLGLTGELGRRANLGLARRGGSHAHDRGAVLRDLVVNQVACRSRGLAGLWSALARVRAGASAAGATPAGPLCLDLDATLLDAHAAARLVRHARQVILCFDHDWPWAPAPLAAFARLRALPWPARC